MALKDATIATVGSGVMAEAMIAGLLRGERVSPEQVIASHPRADRRAELLSSYGIRTVEDNASAVEAADVIVLAIKPQMLVRVGREIAPMMRDGKLRHQHHRRCHDARPLECARAPADRAQHAQHAGPARTRHDRLVRHPGGDRDAA